MFNSLHSIAFVLGLALCTIADPVDLHGTVTNQAGKPVKGAIVTLKSQSMKDTTGSDGTYVLSTITATTAPRALPEGDRVFMRDGRIVVNLSKPAALTVSVFDIGGTLLSREQVLTTSAGKYRFTPATSAPASGLRVVRVSLGQSQLTFRYIPLSKSTAAGTFITGRRSSPGDLTNAATFAVDDTLTVSAAGYREKSLAITSYEQKLDITLDSAAAGSTGSIGCGKDLGDLKSGTYKITSAGLSREYIIDIPANYDKNKPYRLIFGMHCMGSSDQGVVSENYYSLKPLAQKANIPCIFVAPQGYTDNSPWRVSDNKDHTFFSDMLKLFKEKLCVDTARIFCCGFSYGAMVSYSISTEFQDQLRAVATYAPANWNIWLPTNTHKPIAYYQTTGTADNLCSWVNSDARKEGGKYCVLQHLEDNGCPAPSNIPLANSGKHVTTEFPGCPEEYPVIFASHNGGHQGTASDQGSSENWIAKETWEFFMRF